jgi:glycosyltransferase involved in cell wall biosynthesis
MRFFMLGYSHLPASRIFTSCAFSNKNFKLAKMLCGLGHEVVYFGARGESHEPLIEEYINSDRFSFVETHTLKDIRDDWGEGYNLPDANGIGYPWKRNQFRNDFNQDRKPSTKKFYAACIDYINKHKKEDDFLLLMQGYYHKPIDDAVGLYLTCEPGIGYRGSYAKYRAFESRYIQYFTYGAEHPREDINGNYYDRVIPNYFDIDEFEVGKKKDYYLYMGRMIQRKGVWTAIKACQGKRLILAGQPDNEIDIKQFPDNCEYVGQVGSEDRKKLMSEAIAVFAPTIYLEPFGGVAVEAMLSGTPIITTNFGAFTDYNEDGVTGYKCNTLQDFVDATEKVKSLDPKIIRKKGERFNMENVVKEYQKWFEDLYSVYESATIPEKLGWHRVS